LHRLTLFPYTTLFRSHRVALHETKPLLGIGPDRYGKERVAGDRKVVPSEKYDKGQSAKAHPEQRSQRASLLAMEQIGNERHKDQYSIEITGHNDCAKKGSRKPCV